MLTEVISQIEQNQYDDLMLEQMEANENSGQMLEAFDRLQNAINVLTGSDLVAEGMDNEPILDTLATSTRELAANVQGAADRIIDAIFGVDDRLKNNQESLTDQLELQRLRDLETNREKPSTPTAVPINPWGKGNKEKDQGFNGLMAGAFKILGRMTEMIGAGAIGAGLTGVIAKAGKAIGFAKNIFKPLAVAVGLYEAVTGFIEGFNAEDGDGDVQRLSRGLIRGFKELVDTLIMKFADWIKDGVSFIAEAMGNNELAEYLDSFSFSDEFTRLMSEFEKWATEWVGAIGNWVDDLIISGKQALNKIPGIDMDIGPKEYEGASRVDQFVMKDGTRENLNYEQYESRKSEINMEHGQSILAEKNLSKVVNRDRAINAAETAKSIFKMEDKGIITTEEANIKLLELKNQVPEAAREMEEFQRVIRHRVSQIHKVDNTPQNLHGRALAQESTERQMAGGAGTSVVPVVVNNNTSSTTVGGSTAFIGNTKSPMDIYDQYVSGRR